MSRLHSRAAFFSQGRTPDSGPKPTTLTEKGDYSASAAINTGTKTEPSILLGGSGNRWQQPGAGDNRSQCQQAYDSFMGMRKSRLFVEDGNSPVDENRQNRQQAKMRRKGEIF